MRSRCSAPNSASITLDERTKASVLRNTSANSESNVDRMVSEKMKVDERNAVAMTTARAVISRRVLWARTPFRLILNMAQSENCFIRSSTRSAVGARISSTILPSPRNTTRSE